MPSSWSELALQCGGLCSMSDTMESFKELGGTPPPSVRIKHLTRNSDGSSRFPKLDECAHFHYDNVELGPVTVCLCEAEEIRVEAPRSNSGGAGVEEFRIQVTSNGKSWQIRRSLDNFQMLDRQLHRCVYDRKFSLLQEIESQQPEDVALRTMLTHYLDRFSQLAGSIINCGPVLNWLELDNRGNRLIVTDEAAINTPAIAAAYVIKRYASQATDEISLEVGDIISVIDMPPPDESSWWRGKKGFQVGFFPCECVEIIGDKIPQSIKIPKAQSKPVLRKHGKLIAFFRSFLLTRPSRRKLKQSGILKERVFGCDLGEHLMNTGREIPLVLKCCSEFIEQHGIVDGIYRLSGVTSNIQKLRVAFDEDRVPNLLDEAILQDIHCVASLLKMYFRELPNPLLTFHLYDKFVSAVQADEDLRLLKLRDVVQQLPPPHYRSLEYLMRHLSKVAAYGYQTGMTPKNVAIVWAPNLLRSRDIENGGAGALHVVGVQAVLTEYLIRYTDIIFNEKMPIFPSPKLIEVETPKKTRPKSLAISTPTKLLSLEEARSRALTSNLLGDQQKFIDVGGGEENLPIKYHTVIELPARRRSMGKGKKSSPSSWKSLFSRGWHTTSGRRKNRRLRGEGGERPKIGSPIFSEHSSLVLKDKAVTESDIFHTNTKRLRTVKSAEALFSLLSESSLPTQEYIHRHSDLPSSQDYEFNSLQEVSFSNFHKHARSSSHDSYFERCHEIQNGSEGAAEETSFNSFQTQEQQKVLDPSGVKDVTDDESDKNSLGRQRKIAQKQKLVSFETEASSPKLQKLSLKRLYHTLSSPPMVKKESSKKDKLLNNTNSLTQMDHSVVKIHQTNHSSSSQSVTILPQNVQSSVPLKDKDIFNSKCKDVNTGKTDVESDVLAVEIHPVLTCASSTHDDSHMDKEPSLVDDLDDAINFSMEATLSDSASLSQLMSFDSKEQNIPESFEHKSGCSWVPLDSSLATPESPTGDNVSDLPSSDNSVNSDSTSDVNKLNSTSDAFVAEVQDKGLVNNCANSSDSLNQRGGKENASSFTECDKDEQSAYHSENNIITNSSSIPKDCNAKRDENSAFSNANISNAQNGVKNDFIDNLMLSPPASFGDTQKSNSSIDHNNVALNLTSELKMSAKVPSARTMERSKTEVHEICPKFVSGIAVSGSFAQDLFRASGDSGESFHKKRVGSEKLSPISPIEESKRKFESEIGRLIVRDRQMKLEMEQMKAERQKRGSELSAFSDFDKIKGKSDKKFADVIEFKKSPVKLADSDKKKLDSDDFIKSLKEDRRIGDTSPNIYSRYVRMENKPSVKELLSKFESHKEEDSYQPRKLYAENFPLQKQSSAVFSNVQVINHNYPLTYSRSVGSNCNFPSSVKDNHSKENIFQTECIIRFPHPKTTAILSQNKLDNVQFFIPEHEQSYSWTNGQRNTCFETNTSNSILSSSEDLLSNSPKAESSTLVHGKETKTPTETSWMSKSMESENLNECLKTDRELVSDKKESESASCSITETENSFSSFKDTFNRANKALQMKNEFLKRGLPQMDEQGRTSKSDSLTLNNDRFSRSPTECRKRNIQTRQRPKSVPPPTCRLSFSSAQEHSRTNPNSRIASTGRQAAFLQNVPKTSSVCLTNGKEPSNSSQLYGLPKNVKERAAIFERSLSFSGSVERTAPSTGLMQKAQTESLKR